MITMAIILAIHMDTNDNNTGHGNGNHDGRNNSNKSTDDINGNTKSQ